ncbi:MAG TPA: multiheme c-type cytochrome [Terriglobia bacterium]|nr:multiheme c-type cytochrome [Terriglobia bacterium]
MTCRRQLTCLLLSVCASVTTSAAAQTSSRPVPICASCHEEAKSQPATSMGHALETVEECSTFASHPILTFKDDKYSYRIERRGSQGLYTVSDGHQSLTLPIRYVMGASFGIGQTYILDKDGQLYESRVSYYRELKRLDLTIGAQGVVPADLREAAGRVIGLEEKLRCFFCHATNATKGQQVTLDAMTPGVQCEHCHGPAEKHVQWATKGGSSPVLMKDLTKLSTDEVSDFCGQCHRTWADVLDIGRIDITDVRFQPYRLTLSRCYDGNDARISCLACHNPHFQVDTNPIDYDSKCLACHGGGKVGAKKCRVSAHRCTTCHMPKTELPGAHFKFSDHNIRIVKVNEPFPG